MPNYIIKLEKEGNVRYLEWGGSVDAPITYGMTYEEFLEFYRTEYGASQMEQLLGKHGRMSRVHRKGTSERGTANIYDTIMPNKAGEGGAELDYDGLWQKYVVERPREVSPFQDPMGDYHRLRAMLLRAEIDFRETSRGGEQVLEVPLGPSLARFVCDAEGRLRRLEPTVHTELL